MIYNIELSEIELAEVLNAIGYAALNTLDDRERDVMYDLYEEIEGQAIEQES